MRIVRLPGQPVRRIRVNWKRRFSKKIRIAILPNQPIRRFRVNFRRSYELKKNTALVRRFPYYGLLLIVLSINSTLYAHSGRNSIETVIVRMAVRESLTIIQDSVREFKIAQGIYPVTQKQISFLLKGTPNTLFISTSKYTQKENSDQVSYDQDSYFNAMGLQQLLLLQELSEKKQMFAIESLTIMYP